jgi:hypothetical protein
MTGQRVSPAADQPGAPAGWLRVRLEQLWLAVPILLVLCFGFLLKLRLVDFWWHLKVGEIIVNTRAIPRADAFSFTANGQLFILQNWLAEIIYYAVYRAGGLPLLVAFNASLLVAALLPVYRMCREATDHLRLSVVVAIMPAVLLLYFGSVRTQVFSFVFFSAYYWILSSFRKRRRNLLWALPLMMVLWVNLHGAFVLGLALMGLFAGCEALRRFVYGPRPDTLSAGELSRLTMALAVTLLATFLNPETYKVFGYVRAVATNRASQAFVLEWQPPRINEMEGVLLFYGPFFITLLILLLAKRKPDLIEMALFLGFAVFGLMAVRNGVWYALIAAPIVTRYGPSLDFSGPAAALRRFRLFDALALWLDHRKAVVSPIRYRLNRQIAVLMLTITVLVSPWVYPHLGNPAFGNTLWEVSTPVGAMGYIQEQGLQGHIFHPQIYGDYLIWRLWPQQRSFIDGRVHLFDESVVRDYRLAFHDSHWEERLAKYDIKYLLLSKEEEENHLMTDAARGSANWRVLYEDDRAVLFERAQ